MLSLIACTGATTDATATDSASTTPATDTQTTSSTTDTGPECPPADTEGSGTITQACCDHGATLQILGGLDDPEDLEPGGELPISYSPQYGWELLLFPKICGTRDLVALTVTLTDLETGSTLLSATEDVVLWPDADESCCQDAFLYFDELDTQGLPTHGASSWTSAVCGRSVTASLSAADADGRTALETLDLVFSADEEALGHACGE